MTPSHSTPQVAIDFMNEDHDVILTLIQHTKNQLVAIDLAESIPKDMVHNITQSMLALIQHCKEHFEREESLMQQYHYPNRDEHLQEHQLILSVTEETLTAWQENHEVKRLKQYLEITLPTWLIGHIDTMDTITALFIAGSAGDFYGDNLAINDTRIEKELNKSYPKGPVNEQLNKEKRINRKPPAMQKADSQNSKLVITKGLIP